MKCAVPGTNPNHVPVKRHRGERDTQGTHRSHGQTSQASLTTNPTHKRAVVHMHNRATSDEPGADRASGAQQLTETMYR